MLPIKNILAKYYVTVPFNFLLDYTTAREKERTRDRGGRELEIERERERE